MKQCIRTMGQFNLGKDSQNGVLINKSKEMIKSDVRETIQLMQKLITTGKGQQKSQNTDRILIRCNQIQRKLEKLTSQLITSINYKLSFEQISAKFEDYSGQLQNLKKILNHPTINKMRILLTQIRVLQIPEINILPSAIRLILSISEKSIINSQSFSQINRRMCLIQYKQTNQDSQTYLISKYLKSYKICTIVIRFLIKQTRRRTLSISSQNQQRDEENPPRNVDQRIYF